MNKKIFPSTEAIFHQKDDFFKELTELFRKQLEEVPNGYKWGGDQLKPITECIKKYTNFTVYVSIHVDGPMIFPPALSGVTGFDLVTGRSHNTTGTEILLKEYKKPYLKGNVNRVTGKVEGAFTDARFVLLISPNDLNNTGFLPEEHAALVLHEVGHVITYLSYIDRTYTTNWALSEIAEKYTKAKTIQERTMILSNVKNQAKLKTLDISKLAKTDSEAVSVVIVDAAIEKSKSELGSDIYDINNWEFLSDQYATKYGAGRYLVTGLNKLGERTTPFFDYITCESLKLSIPIVTGLITFGPIGVFIASCIIMLIDIRKHTSGIYDRPAHRLRRIRLQMIERLKDRSLPELVLQQTRDDIKIIDEVFTIGEDRLSIMSNIALKVFGIHKKRYTAERIQHEIEQIAMNDLFLHAFDLNQLSKKA